MPAMRSSSSAPTATCARPIVTMSSDLYTRLIDKCAAAGCREVHLHNFGEPLLDKHLEERIAYAKQQGIRRVKIFATARCSRRPGRGG